MNKIKLNARRNYRHNNCFTCCMFLSVSLMDKRTGSPALLLMRVCGFRQSLGQDMEVKGQSLALASVSAASSVFVG